MCIRDRDLDELGVDSLGEEWAVFKPRPYVLKGDGRDVGHEYDAVGVRCV